MNLMSVATYGRASINLKEDSNQRSEISVLWRGSTAERLHEGTKERWSEGAIEGKEGKEGIEILMFEEFDVMGNL